MNERIDELLDKAKLTAVQEMFEEELYEFAELIVQECSNFLKDVLDDHFAAEQLEEHFGV